MGLARDVLKLVEEIEKGGSLRFKRTLKSGSWLRPGSFAPHRSKWGIYSKDGKILGILQHGGGNNGWCVLDAVTRKPVTNSDQLLNFRQAWDAAKGIFSGAPISQETGGAVLPSSESLILRRMR